MHETGSPRQVFDLRDRRVYVAGHRGMIGSALVRRLRSEQCEIITVDRARLDLRCQKDVGDFIAAERPDVVCLAAATVGGIHANDTRPVEFLLDNLLIEANVISASIQADVKKLLFLGSSCIYPRDTAQPIREDSLLTGPLEPTNQWYAVAKIAGIKLCDAARRQQGRDFITAMPTNLYGPGDTYDLAGSHVLPALMLKASAALARGEEDLEIWGSGRPLREFLHSDDCADGLVFLLKHWSGEGPINLGSGQEISIGDLARMVMRVAGMRGRLKLDTSRPDGAPRKLLDSSRMRALGWQPRIQLEDGVRTIWEAEFGAERGRRSEARRVATDNRTGR